MKVNVYVITNKDMHLKIKQVLTLAISVQKILLKSKVDNAYVNHIILR